MLIGMIFLKNHLFDMRFKLIIIAIVTLFSTILTVFLPVFSGQFIDYLIAGSNFKELIRLALNIIIMSFMSIALSYLVKTLSTDVIANGTFSFVSDSISHIQKIPYSTFKLKFNPTYLTQRINTDAGTIISFFVNNFVNIFLNCLLLLVSILIIFAMNLTIFSIVLLFVPIYIGSYVLMRKRLFEYSLEFKEESNRFTKVLYEQLTNILSIKTAVSFDKSINYERAKFSTYFGTLIRYNKFSYAFSSLNGIIGTLFQSVVLLIGGSEIINGNLSVGNFVVINIYFNIVLASVKYYFELAKGYQEYRSSIYRMDEIYNLNTEINGNIVVQSAEVIELRDTTFNYPGCPPCFTHIDAKFSMGQISIIKGKNGSGKTTLMELMTGSLVDKSNSSIYYDGVPLCNIDHYHLRKEDMSILLQCPLMMDFKVSEYFSHELMDLDDLLDVVSGLGMMGTVFISKHELYELWDRDYPSLSEGEKQKIQLILVFSRDKDILFLDEPTTSLDNSSINWLINHLLTIKESKIIIIATHDSNLLDCADYVLEID